MSLEPGEVLLVVSPQLLLELTRGEVLLVGALLVVEDEEQRVRVELGEDGRVLENWGWQLREGGRRRVRVLRRVLSWPAEEVQVRC